MPFRGKNIQLFLAVAAFIVATVLTFVALAIHEEHVIEAGVSMVIAQFLLFSASLLGIDYKLNDYGSTRHPKQQSVEHS